MEPWLWTAPAPQRTRVRAQEALLGLQGRGATTTPCQESQDSPACAGLISAALHPGSFILLLCGLTRSGRVPDHQHGCTAAGARSITSRPRCAVRDRLSARARGSAVADRLVFLCALVLVVALGRVQSAPFHRPAQWGAQHALCQNGHVPFCHNGFSGAGQHQGRHRARALGHPKGY